MRFAHTLVIRVQKSAGDSALVPAAYIGQVALIMATVAMGAASAAASLASVVGASVAASGIGLGPPSLVATSIPASWPPAPASPGVPAPPAPPAPPPAPAAPPLPPDDPPAPADASV